MFWDTNPAGPDHFVKTGFIDRSGEKLNSGVENIKSFHFVLDDNTFLTDDYIQSVKESTPKGMWYDRDILGLWVAAEGICYTEFNYEKHVIDKLPEDIEIRDYFAGQDWGWTHPGVVGFYGIDSNGCCYRILEIVQQQRGIEWWAEQVLELYNKYGQFPIYCPPDQPGNKDYYRAKGIEVKEAETSVFEGISWIASEFKKTDNFKIIRDTNQNYLKEIYGYRWKPGKEEPIKEIDDSMDSDRYARYTHIGRGYRYEAKITRTTGW
jgi:PBSX family phage terminase large subunit